MPEVTTLQQPDRPSDLLEDRLEFETLISDTSAALFKTPPEQVETTVELALARVREFFGADRCALLSVSADQQEVHVHLASYAEGVPPVSPDLNLRTLFPWSWRRLLVERGPLRISRREELPPEAAPELPAWEETGIRSALALPVETGAEVRHLVVIQTVRQEREWPEVLVLRLRVLAGLLAGALERKELVTGLREARDRMAVATEAADAWLWDLDFGTGIFSVPQRARAAFGYSPDEEITTGRFEASIHPDDRDRVRGIIDRATQENESLGVEYRILPGDGSVRWILSRGRTSFKPTGAPDHMAGISIDITDGKRAEEALRRTEARLVSGADLAGLAYYEVDFEAGSAYLDTRFRDLLGAPPERTQGLQALSFWIDHLHPEDHARVMELREQLHSGKMGSFSLEYRYLHPTRGLLWFHHLAGVTRVAVTGHAIVTHGVLRDITDRKRADQERTDLSRRLIRAHEDERALLARELHDDVTQRLAVLAIDVGRAELVPADAAQAEQMRAVREGLARLSEDVHSLAYQLHPAVLEELGLVEALRTACERFGRRDGVALSMDLAPVAAGLEKDLALCLFRVAQEALNNVARHARAGAASLNLRAWDGGLLLTVRDDGVGFDPADPEVRRSLGMASMRERVGLVNGTLEIESAPGRGTSIVAWVPAGGAAP